MMHLSSFFKFFSCGCFSHNKISVEENSHSEYKFSVKNEIEVEKNYESIIEYILNDNRRLAVIQDLPSYQSVMPKLINKYQLLGNKNLIHIDFNQFNTQDFNNFYNQFCEEMSALYFKYENLINSDKLSEADKENFYETFTFLKNKDLAERFLVEYAVINLVKLINKASSQEVVVLIDGYTAPIFKNSNKDIYQFLKTFYAKNFKDTAGYFKGIVTGLPMSSESLLSNDFVYITQQEILDSNLRLESLSNNNLQKLRH